MNKKADIKKLIIIGNGMDIDHELETKWDKVLPSCFINELKRKSDKMNFSVDEWNDFEKDIKKMVTIHFLTFIGKRDYKKFISYTPDWELKCNIKKRGKQIVEEYNDFLDGIIPTDLTIKIKEKLLENIEIQNKKKIHCKPKYCEIFREKDYFILNYNYTTIYNGKYFDEDDVIHIHGKIEKEKTNHSDLKLGFYKLFDKNIENYLKCINGFKDLLRENNFDILRENNSDINEKKIEKFICKIGNYNNFFKKDVQSNWDELKCKIDINKIEEIIFIGHSLNDIDINEFTKQKIYCKQKIKKITSYNKFEDCNDYEKHNKKLKTLSSVDPTIHSNVQCNKTQKK